MSKKVIQVYLSDETLETLDWAKKIFKLSRGAVIRTILEFDPLGILMLAEKEAKQRQRIEAKQHKGKLLRFKEFCDSKKQTDAMLADIAKQK
jgi:hypothetical protein